MSAIPYRPLQWSDNEPIYTDKLNYMTANDQWLFENMPRTYYSAHGIRKNTGVRTLAGVTSVPANRKGYNSVKTVNFGSFFSSGCRPVVVASISTGGEQKRFHLVTRGLGATQWPDHRGFEIHISADEVNPKKNHINYQVGVSYIVTGW